MIISFWPGIIILVNTSKGIIQKRKKKIGIGIGLLTSER